MLLLQFGLSLLFLMNLLLESVENALLGCLLVVHLLVMEGADNISKLSLVEEQ